MHLLLTGVELWQVVDQVNNIAHTSGAIKASISKKTLNKSQYKGYHRHRMRYFLTL